MMKKIKKLTVSALKLLKEYLQITFITGTAFFMIAATDFMDDIIWDAHEFMDDAAPGIILIPLAIIAYKRLKK